LDDSEHVEDAIFDLEVVHDPVVADSKAVEGVGSSPDRPYPFAADPPGCCGRGGKLLEASPDPGFDRTRQLAVDARRRGREKYLIGVAQASRRRGWERPLR